MAKKENKWFENYPLRNIKLEKAKQNKSIGNSRKIFFFFNPDREKTQTHKPHNKEYQRKFP